VYDGQVLRLAAVLSLVVSLVACSSPPTSPNHGGATPARRAITPRAKLPAALQPVLPAHGIYAAGGGLVSSAWRVIVDTDQQTIAAGSSTPAHASSIGPMEHQSGPMEHQSTKPLSQRNRLMLTELAEDAWREPPSKDPPDPTADYDEIFVVLDGDATFYLEGFGPIRQPLAAKAIIELRAAAGL